MAGEMPLNALMTPVQAASPSAAPQNALMPPRPDVSHLMRQPYPGELQYFQQNPRVGGMATEDGRIILNPYSPLKPHEQAAVAQNEAARLAMRGMAPPPVMTKDQSGYLATVHDGQPYGGGNDTAQRETIIGRYLSGDPSAGQMSPEQTSYAAEVARQIQSLGRSR
jgi:hypothetical protein